MEVMDTGYKPEFGLGAYLQGQNAANAESMNTEDLIRKYLANQREKAMLPLDTDIRAQEADLARAKMADPDYKRWLLEMSKGQGKTMGAAGDRAQAALQGNIANDSQSNLITNLKNAIEEKLWRLKSGGVGSNGGAIGFSMGQQSQPQVPAKTFENFFKVSPEEQAARDSQRLGILQNEQIDNPQDDALGAEIKRLTGVQPTQMAQAPTGDYESTMQALMDTPEFRQKLKLQDERLNTQEELQRMRNEAALARQASSKKATDLITQVTSGKLSYEKGAVAFEVMAMQETDPVLKQQYLDMASKFGQEALKVKAAGATTGKTDIEAVTGGAVPTMNPTTGLGKSATKSNKEQLKELLK